MRQILDIIIIATATTNQTSIIPSSLEGTSHNSTDQTAPRIISHPSHSTSRPHTRAIP